MNILISKIRSYGASKTLFFATSVFYAILLVGNFPNKFVLTGYIGYLLICSLILKDLRFGLFCAFFSSIFINTGQTYYNFLINPGILPIQQYPDGYVVKLVISYVHIISFIGMIPVMALDLIKRKISLKINSVDLALFSYYTWIIVSNIFSPNQPLLASLYGLLSLYPLVGYIYLRCYGYRWKNLQSVVIILTVAVLLFESLLSILQFRNNAPIGNSLEEQQDIIAFGEAVDELPGRYRPLGTFWHANELASFLSFVLPLLSSIAIMQGTRVIPFSIALGVIVMILTLSRSGWIAAGGSTLFLIYYYVHQITSLFHKEIIKKIGILVVLIIPFFLGFFIFPRIEKSINSLFSLDEGGIAIRRFQTENSLLLIQKYPLFGTGTKMSVVEGLNADPSGVMSFFPSPVHNIFLLMIVENGLPAFAFFLLFEYFFVRRILRKSTKTRLYGKYLPVGIFAGFIGANIVGLFHPFLPLGVMLVYAGTLTTKKNYYE